LQTRVPNLVGGSGERRTLRLVARYADACNLFGEPETVARKIAVLRRHCDDAGRDPAAISVSHLSTVLVGDDGAHVRSLVEQTRPAKVAPERHARAVNAGTVDQHVDRVGRYIAAGVDHVVVSLPDVHDPAALERYGRLMEACRASFEPSEAPAAFSPPAVPCQTE
jgi:alkanesulfonate monooxygenase SsuD/methylene tetrahydromethanopterin reductase-like flavin-dependent oxidoreductase (luciferase family)